MGKFVAFAKWVQHWFWLLMLLGLVLSIIWPAGPVLFFPYITPLLAIMLFCAFLKIDGKDLWLRLRHPGPAIYFALGKLVVFPLLLWFLTPGLLPNWRVALLLLAAMPQGVATPTILELLGGDVALGFSYLLLSYLLVPFTVPMVMKFCAGASLPLDPWIMAWDLSLLIFIPFFLARVVRMRWDPRPPQRSAFLSLVAISSMLALTSASAASESHLFFSDPAFVFRALIVLYSLYLILGAGGWALGRGQGRRGGATGLVCGLFFNNSLAVVLVGTHLSGELLAVVVIGAIPWDTLQGPVAYVVRRMLSGSKQNHKLT